MNPKNPVLIPGAEAPPFDLPGVDGARYSLDSFAGAPVLVVIFSCNHCPYVKAYEERMVQIQADYQDKGVRLIAINANDDSRYPEDSFDNMKRRAKERGFNFPYVHDASQETAHAYGARFTPEVFVFDRKRKLVYHGRIDDSTYEPGSVKSPDLRNALDAVLAGHAPGVRQTTPVGCTIKWRQA
ncbi:MAG: Thiol-disulfide oxidoreductase ResA [Myxococcota bacterium]|nr:Thiol-disulfide oxidoreductase ResA [Myxococcota bacterium]